MNLFDLGVGVLMIVALATGFRSGLLRSIATIVAYLAAAPIAVIVAPKLASSLPQKMTAMNQNGELFFWVLLALGVALGALMRSAVASIAGEEITMADRLSGALLGAVRVAMLAVFLVLVFDRIIPSYRMPEWYAQSKLRPILSNAGQQALRKLPPDATAYIERTVRERGR